MKREAFFTVLALVSLVFLPKAVTIAVTLVAALFVPFLPLAVGILADALYLAPGVQGYPLYSLLGAALSVLAFVVRARLKTGIIKG